MVALMALKLDTLSELLMASLKVLWLVESKGWLWATKKVILKVMPRELTMG